MKDQTTLDSSRRDWFAQVSRTAAVGVFFNTVFPDIVPARAAPNEFRLRYILASPLYGTTPLPEVLGEVAKSGAEHVDLWPRVHANHREQVEEMGHERFAALLDERRVKLGMTTRYDQGPYGLDEELKFVQEFGGRLIVTGADRLKEPTTKDHVRSFVERLQPQVEKAEQHNVTLAIENHGGMLLNTLDAIRWFGELAKSPRLGLALAPAHLPQDAKQIAQLIEDLGPKLVHFYAWQTGDGFLSKLPKDQELKQLPGRGALDFAPLLAALRRAHYDGWVEIFMHPTPRGSPILESTAQVTAAVNAARMYLEQCSRHAPP